MLLQRTTPAGIDEILEAEIDSSDPLTLVGEGFNASYDSVGDTVLMQHFRLINGGPDFSLTVRSGTRETFGTSTHLGTPDMGAAITHLGAVDRAIAVIGEGPGVFSPTQFARLAIVNARTPNVLIYLADFVTPASLQSGRVRLVAP